MVVPKNQFDAQTQFDQLAAEIDIKIVEIRAAFDRLAWLRERLAEEREAMAREIDAMEIYTEADAAALLQLKPSHLADLRRRHSLPHVNFGSVIRYTKPQIIAICETLTINRRPAVSSERSAVKKAA